MALGLLAVMAVALVAIGSLGGDTLPERQGPPIEDLRVEKTVLEPGEIELTVRNAGPDDVTVAQVIGQRLVRRLRRRRRSRSAGSARRR